MRHDVRASHRQNSLCDIENFCENVCPCDRSFAPTVSYTNFSWFDCRDKIDFSQKLPMSHKAKLSVQHVPVFEQFVQ